MQTSKILSSTLVAGFIAGSAFAVENTPPVKHANPISVSIINAKKETIGTVIVSEVLRGVRFEISVSKLTPGKHAVHIHEKGLCDAPEFKTAGGHFNPNGQAHGFDQASGPHSGDLPNLIVDEKGNAKAEMVSQNVTLDQGTNALLKKDGTALVIHAQADDDHSQPAGNSGDRIACAVIKK